MSYVVMEISHGPAIFRAVQMVIHRLLDLAEWEVEAAPAEGDLTICAVTFRRVGCVDAFIGARAELAAVVAEDVLWESDFYALEKVETVVVGF